MRVTVAQGDQVQAAGVKVPAAEVGQVPSQRIVPDFILVVSFCCPFLRGKGEKGREREAVLLQHGVKFPDTGINFGAFHLYTPPFVLV